MYCSSQRANTIKLTSPTKAAAQVKTSIHAQVYENVSHTRPSAALATPTRRSANRTLGLLRLLGGLT